VTVAGLAAGFALLALLLAATGLYGVLADGVDRRTREIGASKIVDAHLSPLVVVLIGRRSEIRDLHSASVYRRSGGN
jgi:hypothetical protein